MSRSKESLALLPWTYQPMGSTSFGCDPTWSGTDHTREHIPVLAYGSGIVPGSLGRRETFADIGQTIAAHLGLSAMDYGESFLVQGAT